jgi:acyl carrier protein
VPGPELRLKILYLPGRFTRNRAEELLAALASVLTGMSGAAQATVRSIRERLPAATRGRAAAVARARRVRAEGAYAAPGTAMEQAVAEVWSELFQVARVGLDANFFDLGGHSLLLLQAHARLRERVRSNLPVVALFQYPTVRTLARYLAGESGAAKSAGAHERAQKQKEALSRMRSLPGRKR